MKKKILITLFGVVCCFLQQARLFAQYLPKCIAPYRMNVSVDKTSNLIFPAAIKSVDRGSTAVLAQKAPGVENILQIKAGEQNFRETNMTVITADGQFYSFAVSYSSDPSTLNYSFVGDSSDKAMIEDQRLADPEYKSIANTIKSKRHQLHKSTSEGKVKLSLKNIFSKDDLLWLEISISNKSPITYAAAFVRFFIRDTKRAKRTAVQEIELTPLFHTDFVEVRNGNTQLYVFAFKPFAVQGGKELTIEVGEAQSGRSLTLPLSHRTMQKVKSL